MTAQEILKMIEEVDPNDTAKLDEIDAMVGAYIGLGELLEQFGGWGLYNDKEIVSIPEYTRSRDALKQIRPEGWTFEMSQVNDGGDWGCELTNLSDNKIVGYFHGTCESFKTEELAELYTTIQAIEYERTKK